MASTVELPRKSTRRMTEAEVREEAARFNVPPHEELEVLRAALKEAVERRWQEESSDAIAAFSAWVDKNGLPLERYRCW